MFVSAPAMGHFHPLVPLALALHGAGDDVVVASAPSVCARAEEMGLAGMPAGPELDQWFAALQSRVRGTPGEGLAPQRILGYFLPRLFGECGAPMMADDLVPLVASLTHQLVELLGKSYVDAQRELTRQRQQSLMGQYISGPLAEWLAQWPATGGSAFERLQLALDTTVDALTFFRDRVLREGRWSFDGGATLTTYFIGACILTFPNVFRLWQRAECRWKRSLAPSTDAGCIAIRR